MGELLFLRLYKGCVKVKIFISILIVIVFLFLNIRKLKDGYI